MISVVTNAVNLLASITQCLFISASLLGKIIVATIITIFTTVFKSAESLFLFFRIVYEDNVTIFTEELPNLAVELLETAVKQWVQVQNHLSILYYNIVSNLELLIGTMRWSLEEMFIIVSDILLLWKKTLIFLGETLWLMLTFIPVHLPHLLREIWKNIRECVYHFAINTYMTLLKFTNFLTDMPLESFVGILITMIIVRLCIHFRDTLRSQSSALYWIFIRKVLYFYYMIYNYFNDYETRLITHMASGQQLVIRGDAVEGTSNEVSNAAEALCIICQERPKSVLTLPCRHICLCTECCMRLYRYQRTCPICRTFIYHSVNVYL